VGLQDDARDLTSAVSGFTVPVQVGGGDRAVDQLRQRRAAVTEARGRIPADEIAAAHDAGLTDEEIVEIVANVARNIFSNYVNEALGVDVEWLLVTPHPRAAAA
jgi:alkylhydroperoxidase family enzyme